MFILLSINLQESQVHILSQDDHDLQTCHDVCNVVSSFRLSNNAAHEELCQATSWQC